MALSFCMDTQFPKLGVVYIIFKSCQNRAETEGENNVLVSLSAEGETAHFAKIAGGGVNLALAVNVSAAVLEFGFAFAQLPQKWLWVGENRVRAAVASDADFEAVRQPNCPFVELCKAVAAAVTHKVVNPV